uniref:At1g61320/AtMIF1 LRR domain-containing protein n=1 Tax=Oryza punctata TaxID=4537 RepID=A0A0E0LM22_ORYPU
MADHYVNLIDKLVEIALCRGVEDLDLRTKLDQTYQRPDTAWYKFPLSSFTDGKGLSLLKLKLCQCTLSISTGFDGFKSVVELSFSQMHISDDMIQTLLENCPKLKSFHLNHCWGVSSLKIMSRYLELRDMMIRHCFQITRKLSIDFPLLTSLIIEIATFLLKNTLTPRGLPVAFRNLRFLTLHVNLEFGENIGQLQCLPHLNTAHLFVVSIYIAKVLNNEKREQPGGVLWEPSDIEHHHLRQVEMYHFRVVQSEIALAS